MKFFVPTDHSLCLVVTKHGDHYRAAIARDGNPLVVSSIEDRYATALDAVSALKPLCDRISDDNIIINSSE